MWDMPTLRIAEVLAGSGPDWTAYLDSERVGRYVRNLEAQPPPTVKVGLLVHGVDDAAAINEGDMVGNLFHVLSVVRREQDAATLFGHDAG